MGLNGLSKAILGFLAGALRWRIVSDEILPLSLVQAGCVFLDSLVSVSMMALLGQPIRWMPWWALLARILVTTGAGLIVFHLYNRYKFPPVDLTKAGQGAEEKPL